MSDSRKIIEPRLSSDIGSIHPINQIKDYIINFLVSRGFTHISGPEIETEEYNFDMLNINAFHPARQMHDTFYVNKKSHLLRKSYC